MGVMVHLPLKASLQKFVLSREFKKKTQTPKSGISNDECFNFILSLYG